MVLYTMLSIHPFCITLHRHMPYSIMIRSFQKLYFPSSNSGSQTRGFRDLLSRLPVRAGIRDEVDYNDGVNTKRRQTLTILVCLWLQSMGTIYRGMR